MTERPRDEDPRDLEDYARLDVLLREMAPVAEPPAGLRDRTLAAIAAEVPAPSQRRARPARPRRRPRLRLMGGAAVVLAASALALVLVLGGLRSPGFELRAKLSAPGDAQVIAQADVTETGIGRVIEFDTDALPILPKSEFYELWFVGPGDRPGRLNRISAGTFHPDPQGRSQVTFAAAVDPEKYPVLSVTAEPGDGDPRPTGAEVLRSRGN